MPISFTCHNISFNLKNRNIIKKWLCNVIINENKIIGNINFIFTGNSDILEINTKYLKHNYFTDIITFDYSSDNIISGDIFISIPTVSENSQIYKTTFNHELMRVVSHGVLHLLGFKDKTKLEQKQMRLKENFYLSILFESN